MAGQILPVGQTGLVLQGGGARGAYQVGVLKAIASITGSRRNPFPVIAGASAGAINAASLAASAIDFQLGAQRLETLWRGLTSRSVYETGAAAIAGTSIRWLWTIAFGGLGIGGPRWLLDNTPLDKLLHRNFRHDDVARAIDQGALRALGITASSYNDDCAVTFFEAAEGIGEWQRARRRGVRGKIQVDHMMASSALPFVFSPVRLGSGYFGDGSMRLRAPLSPAIRMGADRLMVIGARDSRTDEIGHNTCGGYPSIGEIAGHTLDILFNDNLDSDVERLMRINNTLQLLSPHARVKSGLRIIDLMMIQPSRDLRTIAGQYAHEMPGTISLLLRSLGSWDTDGHLVSYLMFEPGYLGALIDLGYADTMARGEEMRDFLRC